MALKSNTVWRVVKWFSVGLGILILLIAALVLFLTTPYGQKIVKNQGEKYLRNKLHTNLSIGSFRFQLKKGISLTDIYIEDLQKRRLLSVHNLDIVYDFNAMLDKNILLNEIRLRGVELNIHRDSTSDKFNFDFISEAFTLNESENVDDSAASAFTINFGKFQLDSISFMMDDQYIGQKYTANINSFKTDLRKTDLDKMIFHADYIFSDGVNMDSYFNPVKKIDAKADIDTSSSAFQFVSDTIAITRAKIKYESVSDQPIKVVTDIGSLNGKGIDYRSELQSLVIGSINLQNHTSTVNTRSAKTKEPGKQTDSASAPFRFKIDSLTLGNNNISYSDDAFPRLNNGAIDFNHLGISNLNINASDLSSDGNLYGLQVSNLSLAETSGFRVRSMEGKLMYSDSVILLENLLLKTSDNQIAANADIRIIKVKGKSDNYLIKSILSTPGLRLNEVLYFQPDLARNKYFTPLLNKSIQLNTNVDGSLDNLNIRQLVIREGATRINASAEVKNLPDVDRMVINLRLNELSSTRAGILALLPKGTLPDSLLSYIPLKFNLKGTYRGSFDNMYTDLQLLSSSGNATVKGTLKNATDKNKAVYDLSAGLRNLDLGSILADTTMGKVTGTVKLKGKGFDPKTMVADYSVQLADAFYSGYTYQQVGIKGKIDHYKLNAEINSADPNAALDGTVSINLNEGSRSLKTNAHIQHVDLNKLGFLTDTVELSGVLVADFPLIDQQGLEGSMLLTETAIRYNETRINLDTVKLDAHQLADSQFVKLVTPYTDVELKGHYKLQDLSGAVTNVINRYFVVNPKADTTVQGDVDAVFTARFNIPDSIASLVGVKSVSAFSASGSINSSKNELMFFTSIPSLEYGEAEIDSLAFSLKRSSEPKTENPEELKFMASIHKLVGPSYELEKSFLVGGAKKGIINGKLEFQDDKENPRYLFPFLFTNDPERPHVHIPDSLLINREKWSVSKDNKIYIDTKQLSGSSLSISKQGTTLDFKTSANSTGGLPMVLNIKEFQIRDIAEIFISDTALANGTINGRLDISSTDPLRFTTDIKIDSLVFKRSRLGNLHVLVDQKETGVYNVNTTLKNDHNDVNLVGNYNTNTKNADLVLKVVQLDLADLKPIVTNQLADLGGKLKGELAIKGSLDEPSIRGKLNTDSVYAIYGMTGTFIRVPTSEFSFDENGIQFSDLNITDSLGHPGKITGRVNTKNYKNFKIDLAFKTQNFEIVGRKKIADQGIYGPTNANINMTIRGDEKALFIEGKVDVVDKSEFTYVYRSETYDQIGEGLVEFFDPSKPVDTSDNGKDRKSSLGMQLTMNMYINITPASSVTIVLDEISGDHLKIKGRADLNYLMRPGGGMELVGNYVIDDGDYDLSLAGLIRRKFKVEKGSTITWSGNPKRGIMDITAKYETRIAAGQLVNDIESIPGINKQKLNFDVIIMLKNELLKPDISFKFDMDKEDQEAFDGLIYTRIKQINNIPAELNKQVMGVLAFNQFIAENPFSSFTSSGGDFQTQAFNTAGKLLTQELTDLVGKYVKDVNIDFGLKQDKDYTSGQAIQRTDLQVGLSKSFADNRLNVYVGSTFALEGTNQDAEALDGLAGDVTLEYLLTSDGKYRLKAYRLTDNDLSFQGNVIRTGVSFVVVLEFNKFKNMFKKPRKRTI